MAVNASQLLKQLEPAVRPASAPQRNVAANAPFETQSFEQLLSQASRGAIQSGRQVQLAIEPSTPLSAAQLERLSAAADHAEAAGSKRALMLIDGRGFVLDVASRTIVAELAPNSAAANGVDAAFLVPNDLNAPAPAIKPPQGAMPASLMKHMQQNANDTERHRAAR